MRIRTRRQAPLALLAFAAVLVLFQVAFHYPIAQWFPHVRDVEYGKKIARLKQIAAEKSPDRPLVVAFGSSLTAMGFCPAAINDSSEPARPVCYNFAINSCGVVVQLLCLQRILDQGLRPDLVLIELSPYFLTREKNLVNDGEFLPPGRVVPCDFRVLDRYRPHPARFRTEWGERQCLPWWSYRNTIQQWADPKSTPPARRIDHIWSRTDDWGWEYWPESVATHAGYHHHEDACGYLRSMWRTLTAEPHDAQMEAAVHEIVHLCRAHGIRPVVVLVPESSFLRESYDPAGRRRFDEVVNRLKHDRGAEIVDARDWLDDPQFIEGLHPNPAGSHAYTVRLGREALRKHFSTAVAGR